MNACQTDSVRFSVLSEARGTNQIIKYLDSDLQTVLGMDNDSSELVTQSRNRRKLLQIEIRECVMGRVQIQMQGLKASRTAQCNSLRLDQLAPLPAGVQDRNILLRFTLR